MIATMSRFVTDSIIYLHPVQCPLYLSMVRIKIIIMPGANFRECGGSPEISSYSNILQGSPVDGFGFADALWAARRRQKIGFHESQPKLDPREVDPEKTVEDGRIEFTYKSTCNKCNKYYHSKFWLLLNSHVLVLICYSCIFSYECIY